MLKTYQNIWKLLLPQERTKMIFLFMMMIIMAILEMIELASIMPFLSVLGEPQVIKTNPYLFAAYSYFGFKSSNSFLVALGLLTLALLVIATAVKSLTKYSLYRFSNMRRNSIGARLLRKYLSQPYLYFLNRNTSELSKTILSEVDQVVSFSIESSLSLLVYGAVSLAMLGLIVMVNPLFALAIFGVFGAFYSIVYLLSHRLLAYTGNLRISANTARYKTSSEVLGGIKDLKVLGRENAYIREFEHASVLYSKCLSTAQIISEVPQHMLELLAFGLVLLILLYVMIFQGVVLGAMLPVIGLYVLGILRLKPSINQIYVALTRMRVGAPILEQLVKEFSGKSITPEYVGDEDKKRLRYTKDMVFENVSFKYPGASSQTISDISLRILANTTVGVVGPTGAGKTTLIDLILGLLPVNSGRILIDGIELCTDNTRSWQNNIGYVPQSIFLADDTVSKNIAFGVPDKQCDQNAIEQACRMAQIHDFIMTLPKGYNTVIGERGVRLSGGQRQRLGIARALYHDPDLLVLDEATNALDSATEAEVMSAINKMCGKKTIIMIAHRTNTVQNCEQIVALNNGRIVEEGK